MTSPYPIELFDLLHDLLHDYRARIRECIEQRHPELTFNEMRVLMHTGRRPGLTQKALIEHSHTDKAQMTRILVDLERRGVLKRTPSERDRRVRCLHLSASGKALFTQLRDVQQKVANELLQDVPEDVQRQLLSALQTTQRQAG